MAEETTNNKEVEEGKVCAILAFVSLIGVIWYFVDEKMKKNSYAKFYVQQALVLAVTMIVAYVGLFMLNIILGFIPFIGLIFAALSIFLWFGLWILGIVLVIMGIIGAAGGTKKELPIIGKYGSKFNI
ncbi:MAG: hypothetical protein Q7S53_04615 [bacterium]|nr:hypothetical protein [bacterium]